MLIIPFPWINLESLVEREVYWPSPVISIKMEAQPPHMIFKPLHMEVLIKLQHFGIDKLYLLKIP